MKKDIDGLDVAATDLTLFFGAESFIRKCLGDGLSDPEARTCLQTLIDLIINCDTLYLTLPGQHEGHTSQLAPALKSYFQQLPESSFQLKEEVDRCVQQGFSHFLVTKGFAWARDWVNFQLRSPIVTSGHSLRLGNRMVSEAGLAAWRDLQSGQKNEATLPIWPPLINAEDLRFSSSDMGGLEAREFALCYTFDVYRRGWQYLESVRRTNDEAAYVPHAIRNDALESGAKDWAAISYRQGSLWSWGSYICEVVSDDKYPNFRSSTAVVRLVESIRKAMETTGCPTWDGSKLVDEAGIIKDTRRLREIQEWVIDTARTADAPLLKRVSHPIHEATYILVEEGVTEAAEEGGNSLGVPVVLPFKLAKIVAKVIDPKRVAKMDTTIEKVRRKVLSKLFKASYEYRGLIPKGD